MVRLSAELIDEAQQFINTIKDRELNLRGCKLPVIENMGVTRDQFDVIDLTDNDIKKLDNFPLLKRLTTLYLHNNRVQYIQPEIGKSIPNLKTLALTNNNLCELGDIDALAGCTKLEYVTFIGNPIIHKQNYREYVIYKLPRVRVIDYKRVRLAERQAAKKLFKGKKGEKNLSAINRSAAPNVEENYNEKENGAPRSKMINLSDEERKKIQDAIANAKSLQEVEYLNSILSSGKVPEKGWNRALDLVQNTVKEGEFQPETEEMETDE
ncbi:unnamed protein product [Auanema sp. JU1783]|nr:unnamed protein product [Auanema sp. JU1783]